MQINSLFSASSLSGVSFPSAQSGGGLAELLQSAGGLSGDAAQFSGFGLDISQFLQNGDLSSIGGLDHGARIEELRASNPELAHALEGLRDAVASGDSEAIGTAIEGVRELDPELAEFIEERFSEGGLDFATRFAQLAGGFGGLGQLQGSGFGLSLRDVIQSGDDAAIEEILGTIAETNPEVADRIRERIEARQSGSPGDEAALLQAQADLTSSLLELLQSEDEDGTSTNSTTYSLTALRQAYGL